MYYQETGAHISPNQEACISNPKGRRLCGLCFLDQLACQTGKLWMNCLHGLQCQKHHSAVSEGSKYNQVVGNNPNRGLTFPSDNLHKPQD